MRSTFKPVSEQTSRSAERHPWRSALTTGLGIAISFALLALLWLLVQPLTLLLVAIIIAQAFLPIVDWLEQHMPRSLATLIPYIIVVAILTGIGWLIFPDLVEQSRMLIEAAPEQIDRGRSWFDSIDVQGTDQLVGSIESILQRFGEALVSLPFTIFNSLVDFVLVIFMSIYWLIATPKLHDFAMSLFPEENRRRAANVLHDMGRTMGGYVRGTVIDGIIIAILAYIGLSVIGVQYVLVLAVIQGFGELIPVVGPVVAAVPSVLVALTDSFQQALIVAGFILVLQQFESYVLLPMIMRSQADVPPLLSLIAIASGAALGGLLGAIIAIPIAGALQIMVVRLAAPAERDWAGADDEQTEVGAKPPDDDDE